MNYVVVGAGPSGVTAAETLKRLEPGAAVTLLGNEPEPPYSRMAIPYFLIGKVPEQGTYMRPEDENLAAAGVQYRQGAVKSVDSKARKLNLWDGSSLNYDKLVLATGARPVKPPIEGLNLPGVHHCWTLADARAIAKLAEKGSHVVLLGAGFIGCIIMEALAERGVNLTVVEMGDRMVPRMMNDKAGGMIARWCEAKGISVRLSTKIKKISGGAKPGAKPGLFSRLFGGGQAPAADDTLAVELDNGDVLPAHLVVVAAGVQPNVEFLAGSGVEVDGGILVDEFMATSVEGIYAAGDVARGRDFSTGGAMVHAIQPTATEHGRIAAMNMVGQKVAYQGSLQMNVLDTLGLISCSFGLWEGVEGGETAEAIDAQANRYLSLQFQGDRLVGAQSVGLTDHVGVLRGLIQSRRPLGAWKQRLMADPLRVAEAHVGLSQVG